MERPSTASLTASEDGPESWEVADVEASMHRLLLSSRRDSNLKNEEEDLINAVAAEQDSCIPTTTVPKTAGLSDDLINTVDQFLREAIQNPRERVSVLRLEQDVEMFIRDSTREVMEFQQLPTSYLRLAAHRVAQHYSLQSMVLMDNNMSDGSGSRIIVQKTSNIQLPRIRLADIPVTLPSSEESGAIKVAIKQRQQKGPHAITTSSSNPERSNSLKSVEERKEEYNKARSRIFNSNNSTGGSTGKLESDSRNQDSVHRGGSSVTKKVEGKAITGASNLTPSRSLSDFSSSSSRLPRRQTEKESVGRTKTNNRVAIFRDHEVDRNDPDYDRRYDRYMQRFDPGFGFGGPYTIQPLYAPVYNYNTEFPQLGSNHRPPMHFDHQHQHLPQHIPGAWVSPSAPSGIGYGPAEPMLPPFNSGHINTHSNPGMYLNSNQYPSQHSGMPPYVHPLDPIHRPFTQTHQAQNDMSFGIARPR